jgi:hypothetical protein
MSYMMTTNISHSYWARINKRYILYGFLLSFIICSIATLPIFGMRKAVLFSILINITFLIIMAFAGLIDYLFLRTLFRRYKIIDYNIRQVRELIVEMPITIAYKNALEIVKKSRGIRGVIEYKHSWIIKAETKISWKSFGESMILRLFTENQGITKLQMISEPIMRFTVADFGKNYENVEKLRSSLARYLKDVTQH